MVSHVMERSVFGGGLAIMSTQPLDVTFEIFPGPASGFDAYACKGYATCELRTPGGTPFRVVNLHLQADDPKHLPEIYGPARVNQLATLLDGLRGREHLPTVVCGDLNVPE